MGVAEKFGKVSLRRENRILAVQWIYMCESTRQRALLEQFFAICALFEKDPEQFEYAKTIVGLIQKHLGEIDTLINRFATNWNFARIATVDLSILRLATCELLYRNDIPPIVTINEAIEISKMFSGELSKGFINGVLDRVKGTLSRSLRTASVSA